MYVYITIINDVYLIYIYIHTTFFFFSAVNHLHCEVAYNSFSCALIKRYTHTVRDTLQKKKKSSSLTHLSTRRHTRIHVGTQKSHREYHKYTHSFIVVLCVYIHKDGSRFATKGRDIIRWRTKRRTFDISCFEIWRSR